MIKRPIDPQELYDLYDYNDSEHCKPVYTSAEEEDTRMLDERFPWGDQ